MASNGGTEFPLEERFNRLCEILGEIERDGCEPWSINATTALCHARTLAEDCIETEGVLNAVGWKGDRGF